MKRMLFVVATLALTACGPNEPSSPAQAPATIEAEQLALDCAAFQSLTPDGLVRRFGADQVSVQTLPGPEGISYEASVVYAGDPSRRIEIIWTTAGTAIDSVLVGSDSTRWIGPHGITFGTSLAEVERANGRPFSLYGFDWDYGGWVSNWRDGALDGDCRMRVRFGPGEDAPMNVSGDSEFASDSAEMRAANATVEAFGLMFVRPE